MKSMEGKKVLISGASVAGLSAAWWMNRIGCEVTVVEMAAAPRTNGVAFDFKDRTVDVIRRMGLFDAFKAVKLGVEKVEIKDADDSTINAMETGNPGDELEIERDQFIAILMKDLQNKVQFIFSDRITALHETDGGMQVSFKNGEAQTFGFVLGCDGSHSGVRKLWFGEEKEYTHVMNACFSVAIVPRLLAPQNTMQMYSEPGKSIILNTYKNKTDIIFCFLSEKEISYDYRNTGEQKKIIQDQFADLSWRAPELLDEIRQADNFYFDKFWQIKMPSWTKGRVALVGDAAYCPSPAAGMGASLAMEGAAVLAEAMEEHNGNWEAAFRTYEERLRPYIEEVQAMAVVMKDTLIPATADEIAKRNAGELPF